ncbi:autophagy- protein 21 [Zygosaccharomyces mellis]|uniref:Autophagy-protein 21 n=1 Tax=Zygosaccharomyces mellis TaxID=42258 RepID=A0A4C2EEB4_9SACH|nr:autophagy- protein 21 [Zygosaccharomyces mellis]
MKALRFNQDATCCVVSPSPRLVSIYNCDPFGKCFEMDNSRGDSGQDNPLSYRSDAHSDSNFVIEMLFSTSLVAIADKSQGVASAKRLKIVNTKRKSTICEISFPHQIVDVVMNRKRMCILLDSDQIFIYDISCMKLLETIDLWEDHFKKNTAAVEPASLRSRVRRNNGLSDKMKKPKLALSGDDRSILCFTSYSSRRNNPDSFLLHDVVVYDALNISPINYLNTVHKGDIASISVSHDGKLVATASEKGTIVRVFNTGADIDYEAGNLLAYEFRRGSRPCNLYQLVFDRNATMLGCVGDTNTIHIFDLKNRESESTDGELNENDLLLANEEDNRSSTRNSEPSTQIAHFLSKRLSSSIASQNLRRDFAHVTINDAWGHSLGFPEEFPNQIYVASDDGKFRVYTLPSTAGECVLTKTSTFA